MAAKRKTAYVCSDCGADHAKWQGQCSACGAWNTLSEFVVDSTPSRAGASVGGSRSGFAGSLATVQRLDQIELKETPRIGTGMVELDRVLGGGLVPGSAILIGGHPGAGKSTLLLQVLCRLAAEKSCLYITGEESPAQVAMRAERLQLPKDQLRLAAETDVERILDLARAEKPAILVIDSIQVMYLQGLQSAPGSVAQVRESAAALTRFAKQTGTVLLLVGHVTKDGTLAGPKVLEHMIDCSLMLEGSTDSRFRTLRGLKNRFGAVNELGVFAMTQEGLREVKNPSAIFLNRAEEVSSGSLVTVVWEGTRPLLVELQALVDQSHFGNPRRVCVGLEQNRLAMLLAVLHRHGGVQVGDQDVFANVVGGVRVMETGADLALLLSIVSSFRDRTLPRDMVVFGEVGLAGEIRPVPHGQERLTEAAKHGFTRAIVSASNRPRTPIEGMEVIAVRTLAEALEQQ
ncbi:DNA repair protein RadA [Isoalcanivorax beigongshangi]|uniref:DNA repair protein RadA n=1 Tax=Isoalcanivorax beigongshangi TaxID=3238810 RepID=A0ABV4AER4_9GAMM